MYYLDFLYKLINLLLPLKHKLQFLKEYILKNEAEENYLVFIKVTFANIAYFGGGKKGLKKSSWLGICK